MKLLSFLFFCLLFAQTAMANFNLTILLKDPQTRTGAAGIRVVLKTIKGKELFSGQTNEAGIVQFNDLKLKSFTIQYADQSELYSVDDHDILNEELQDQNLEFILHYLTQAKEDAFIQSLTNAPLEAIDTNDYQSCKASGNFTAPEFIGGTSEMRVFLARTIRYSDASRNIQGPGKVVVDVLVDENGNILKLTVINGIGEAFDREALRAISYFPTLKPATCKGTTVKASFRVYVNFKLG
jgi:TonB family protein